MSRPPHVAIVGAGLMGRWHAHAAMRAGARVTAVVDVDRDAAARLAARTGGGARAAASLDELRSDAVPDVVHVCTPLATHVEQVRSAIALRRAVIVEKPVASTAIETQALIDDARAAGVWIQPVHQTTQQDGVRRAIGWIEGRPLRVFDYSACSSGADGAPSLADVIAADVLPHPLSLLDVLNPTALDAARWDVYRTAPGELAAACAFGDTSVRLLISMHVRPPRHEASLLTDDMTVTADLFHGFAWREPGGVSRAWKIARPFASAIVRSAAASVNLAARTIRREPAYPGLTTLLARVYASLDDPRRLPFDDRHMLAVARARDAILERLAHA